MAERKNIYRDIKAAMLDCAETLIERHMKDIRAAMEEDENCKVSFGLNVKVDYSEATPVVKVRMGIPTSISDEETRKLEDPNQSEIPGTEPEKTSKRAARNSKGKEKTKEKEKELDSEERTIAS